MDFFFLFFSTKALSLDTLFSKKGLFSVTIRQALFIAPCSHTFHYKCIRPLLENHHPAFSCPLCRTFADLEEDVEVEIEYEEEEADEDEPEAVAADGKDPLTEDIDVEIESPPQSDHEFAAMHLPPNHNHQHHNHHSPHNDMMLMEDTNNPPGSRSNSGLGLRNGNGEGGAETEVEGEGSGLGVVSRMRAARRAGGSSADRTSPLPDLPPGADEPDVQMVVDVSHTEMGVAVAAAADGGADGEPVDMDGTIGAKRKR